MVWPFLRSTNTANVFMHIHPHGLQGEEKSERGHTSWPDLQSRKVRSSPRGQNLRFRLFHCTSFEVGRSGGEGERNPLGSPAFHSRISAHLSRIKHSILGASRRRNGRSRPGPCGTQPGWSLQGPLHSWRSSRARKAKSQLLREAGRRVGRQNQSPFL